MNIGDIAHTPGVLALLERHAPKAETTLWASNSLSPEVTGMLRRRFAGQTSKGIMWRDSSLDDWLFDVDQPADVARLTPAVLAMIERREDALEKVRAAQRVVATAQAETMQAAKPAGKRRFLRSCRPRPIG